ncbi:hypothetical protein [Variovorax sp. PAMC26660]|uniref:hypothetical protein n=1 Tax=Variovorax sp. PAMC26660 TaxID=2762322 RepID=UPI00164EAB76|nr:hypothetical protein [Variovorax sp. PAMC26660]QNK66091.1 hypothetical protein H7F35_23205 [Variovorax sp. PAMC26660]
MSRIALASFSGAVKALEPKLLADTIGVESFNQKPGRGDLRPWRTPLEVYTVPVGTKTIYRMGRATPSDVNYWLTWPTAVNAIHGFISGDTTERTYYTGDGPPKQTNNTIALAAKPYPTAWALLGVPAPAQALLVTPKNTGVAKDTEIRYYTYTYVTTLGEESAPAPVSAQVTCKTDDKLDITNVAAPPAGSYGINRIRFYRTQSGAAGDTEFYFLREEVATVTSTVDDNRALGEVLPTDGWLPTPASLTCLTAMWNGMAAGIVAEDGSVRYCIAYKPYAWPIAYETLTPNSKAVALGIYGQRLLILTNGKPMLVSGSGPDALDEQPLEMSQACVAPRSAVGVGHGVVWASPDGLAYFGEAGGKVLTANILTEDQWKEMNPASVTGAFYKGAYFGSYLDAGGVRRGFFIDPVNPTGMFFLEQGFETMYFDESQGLLYVLDGAKIKKWDFGAALMTARFRSKVFTAVDRNYVAARVEAEAYPVTVMFDALDLDAQAIAGRLAESPALFTSPAAGVLRHTRVVTDRKPFRLPGKFVARAHQVEVQTEKAVQWVMVATSMKELAEAP